MRKLLLALLILGFACSPSFAGKNAGGAMIVHTNNTYNYCNNNVCTTATGDPGTCQNAVTNATRAAGQVVWCLAAFPPSSNPGVTVVYFGIDYDDTTLDPGINKRFCGPAGSLEVPDDDWPYTGRGNSVAFGSPVAGDQLFPFYIFRIDGGTDGSYFSTTINPTGGYAAYVDDENPPGLDYITKFGTIRWNAAGFNDCPTDVVPGACCFPDGSCIVLDRDACIAQGGAYQGDATLCDPNPCPQPQGACCFVDGTCSVLTASACATAGGQYQGNFTDCDPNPCPQPQGACCFTDGSCVVLTRDGCVGQGGAYQGNFTVCDPNPCPQPEGACCFVDGTCQVLTAAACAQASGSYQGNFTECDPNP
jgi:hypothetical protein